MSINMSQVSKFPAETDTFKKYVSILTVPCAILPIMMATAALMSAPSSPLLFKYDFLLFLPVYLAYSYGLFLSWQTHKSWLPFGAFLVHITALISYRFLQHYEWQGYITVASIMATSVSNQYFKVGSIACNEDCQA